MWVRIPGMMIHGIALIKLWKSLAKFIIQSNTGRQKIWQLYILILPRWACRKWWACLTASTQWWNCWLVLFVCVCAVCALDIDSMRLLVSVRVLKLWVCFGLPIKGRYTHESRVIVSFQSVSCMSVVRVIELKPNYCYWGTQAIRGSQ